MANLFLTFATLLSIVILSVVASAPKHSGEPTLVTVYLRQDYCETQEARTQILKDVKDLCSRNPRWRFVKAEETSSS